MHPLVSVIIPTKNSSEFLEACLESIKSQTYKNVEIIVVDNDSTDNTKEIAKKYTDKVFNYGPERSAQRNFGAKNSQGEFVVFIDSDMEVTPRVMESCVLAMEKGNAKGVIIPEESFGQGFWAKCKWLEKKCYEGVEKIESLRCLKTSVYKKIGGHNTELVFSEDKDLDIRVKKAGYIVGRIESYIRHNEGKPSLLKLLRKKRGYAQTANKFAQLHPREFAWQRNIFNRYRLYLKGIKYLFLYPHLYLGMFFMKTCEFCWALIGILAQVGRK